MNSLKFRIILQLAAWLLGMTFIHYILSISFLPQYDKIIRAEKDFYIINAVDDRYEVFIDGVKSNPEVEIEKYLISYNHDNKRVNMTKRGKLESKAIDLIKKENWMSNWLKIYLYFTKIITMGISLKPFIPMAILITGYTVYIFADIVITINNG